MGVIWRGMDVTLTLHWHGGKLQFQAKLAEMVAAQTQGVKSMAQKRARSPDTTPQPRRDQPAPQKRQDQGAQAGLSEPAPS
ncbi:hypothetical protein H0H92_008633 [Tricholoma furcatifolium]|nr:hypothetical protein H0H92_008633 [Tricholoma furcatifolium]